MLIGAVALKEDDVQFVTNAAGDIPPDDTAGFGLYYRDTRFLSVFDLRIAGRKPLSISHNASKHYIATFQDINPALDMNGTRVPQQSISIRRSRFVTSQGLYERIGLLNCNHVAVDVQVDLVLDSDFRDIFAVRGFKSQPPAMSVESKWNGTSLYFAHRGRDGVMRRTLVSFSRAPDTFSNSTVSFRLRMEPQGVASVVVRVQPQVGDTVEPMDEDFDRALDRLAASYRDWEQSSTQIETDNELFNRDLLRASRNDVRTLLERTEFGLVPDAGIPWYAVPFGRDAIITALQTLSYNPAIAEGTLRFLAAYQGKELDPFKEEEPGKILHELRRGELARLEEIPHTPYYGTVDSTPLFVVLFVEAMAWIQSDALYHDMLPAALQALEWIDTYGDVDGDGYVEYEAHRPGGVLNHGWKDSATSVQYEDGTNAVQPIALVEVQGYVYAAKLGMARLLRSHGDIRLAGRLEQEAEALRRRFNQDFWVQDEQFFCLALDGQKRQVRSVTSNAGHCLWSGICDPEKADAVAERLMAPDMFSGWGVRTLSADSPNYNPMSYHNGSVWPHDNAIIALGLRRAGHGDKAAQLVQAMCEAGFRFSDARLPELFCGFSRDQRFNSSPAAYVVSCSPQAWAAGSLFMFLESLLDIQPQEGPGSLGLTPVLPAMFGRVCLRNLRIGTRRFDVTVERDGDSVGAAAVERADPATTAAIV
jgi:glycogen debranching enzyme